MPSRSLDNGEPARNRSGRIGTPLKCRSQGTQSTPRTSRRCAQLFYKVCDALLLKCDSDDPMTEIIVNKIVALAKTGERDADRLAARVLNDLADDAVA